MKPRSSVPGTRRLALVVLGWTHLLTSLIIASSTGCSSRHENVQFAPDDTVSSEMMREDFQYVIHKLRHVHPTTIEGFSETQKAIISTVWEGITEPLTTEQFFFKVNELFHSFHDAHTTQWLNFSQGIDLPLLWLHSGLFIARDTDLLRQADLVLRIGGKDVAQLADRLARILWAENDHLLRLEGPWMLSARPYLRHLGLIRDDGVEVTCQRSGSSVTIRLPVIELPPRKKEERPFLSYTISKSSDSAILTLNSCRHDAEYRNALKALFREVRSQQINNIIVDLRRNDGGDSRVIDEFLAYLDVDRIKTYGSTVRYSGDARRKTKVLKFGVQTFPRSEQINKKIDQQELLFSGRLFVLTSPNTFSSANMFAAVIQDNGLGRIVGEPTGNKPSCYGHPLSFRMPRTGIYFKISHKQFFRPDSTLDREDAIYPDIEMYTDIEDVMKDKDGQMERLMEYIETENRVN